jgi:hypothetical protein
MLVKRLALAAISILFGLVGTIAIMWAVGTDYYTYGFGYFFFTALSLAAFLAIWLDKFMKTELLPK